MIEVMRVWCRALLASVHGRFAVAIYPVGGAALFPAFRDLLVLPLFRLLADRVVLHFHAGGHADAWAEGAGLVAALAKRIYRRADLAVVMTAFNARDPAFLGIPRVEVIPHRVEDSFDRSLVTREPDGMVMIYLGHIREEKGFPELLEAFAEVSIRYPRLELRIAGDIVSPLSDHGLVALTKNLGIEDRVTFLGPLLGEAKWGALGAANLMVFPSRAPTETFGLVMVEAMMWELPLVASDWRGNREVAGENGGILFDVAPNFTDQLAVALNRAIDRRDQWAHWGLVNRQRFLNQFDAKSGGFGLNELLRGLALQEESSRREL